VTLGIRVALAPVNVALLRNSLRMKLILPQLNDLGAVLGSSTTSAVERLAAARALSALLRGAKASPFAQTVVFPLVLPPAILTVFGAVHNLAMAEPSMAYEGTLWFPDLIQRDKTQLLPILSALTWLWQVEMGAGVHYTAMPTLRIVTRTVAVAMIPLSATLPAGVFVFWITSNVFAIARGYALKTDAMRRLLHVPLSRQIDKLTHLPLWRGS
jgi:YidC/Oxa1 family membrane protein insertase